MRFAPMHLRQRALFWAINTARPIIDRLSSPFFACSNRQSMSSAPSAGPEQQERLCASRNARGCARAVV